MKRLLVFFGGGGDVGGDCGSSRLCQEGGAEGAGDVDGSARRDGPDPNDPEHRVIET